MSPAVPVPVSLPDRDTAVAALFRDQYVPLLRLVALLVDDRGTAEDVVQEAFLRLHRSWARIDDPAAAPAYLRSTALNLARSGLRRRLAGARALRREPRPVDGDLPDAGALLHDDQRAVVEAVRALPRRQRECVVLRYYGAMTEAEIAQALGVSPGSVKSHTSRAMRALAARLEDRR